MGQFLDVVEDNLLQAYVRLQALARGDYGADPTLESFPTYVPDAKHARSSIGCFTLFERWQSEVKPARSTIARWSTVFKAADARFPDDASTTPEVAKEWMVGLIDKDRTAQTVATVWKTSLKTVFAWAVGEKLVERNPFKEVKIIVPRRTVERETKAFTPDEAETILAGCARLPDQDLTVDERARRWVPWLCAYTGARAGEITQLRGSDITPAGNRLFCQLSAVSRQDEDGGSTDGATA